MSGMRSLSGSDTKSPVANDLKAEVDRRTAEIHELYLADSIPWVIGYSGGKDSTAVLQMVWWSLLKLPAEQRTKPVYVITTDTLVESPVVSSWVERSVARMRAMAADLDGPLFGAVDVGTDAWWWDYGTLQNWHANVRRLLDDGTEPGGMRQFFGVQRTGDSVVVGGAPIGSWSRSVLVDVDGQIDAHDSVAVATRGPLKLDRALLYAVRTEQALRAEDCVLAEGKGPRMQTSLDRDGGADWEVCLPGNPMSYAEWYRSNPEE